jgi:2-methylisocitrate lyase-like PEP mutase family enzyme
VTESAARRLRAQLGLGGAIVCPGVVSPLFARLAESAGFPALYATGAGISNTWLGLPDVGLMGMSELLAVTSRIVDSVTVPVIADIDTGYGNALNVTRTVREFERAGVAALQIEDQINPKRCGHFDDKSVAPLDEMIERLVAAAEARRDPDLVLIARTDSLATDGLNEAIRRAHHFVEAGADMVFIEAPTSEEELRIIAKEVKAPMVINMVEGGKTPVLPAKELADMGYKVILYANTVLRMAVASARRALEMLHTTGGTFGVVDEMATWEERQSAVNLDEWLSLDARVSRLAADVIARSREGDR